MELSQVIRRRRRFSQAIWQGISRTGRKQRGKAQKLRQEYNKQANELNFLEKELEKTTTEFEEFKKAQVEAQRMAESGWGKTSKVFEKYGT